MPIYNLNDVVTNESHTVTAVNADTYHTLIPLHGPFFKEGFQLIHISTTNVVTPLVAGVDYNFALMWISASRVLNDILYGAVTIQTPQLTGTYRINSYKTAGTQWSVPINEVYSLLVTNAYNPRIASWEQVIGEPSVYPPTTHTQPLEDFKGFDEMIQALDALGNHIMTSPALSAHNTDPNAHITNIVSQTDIDKAINNLINGVPIDASVADKPITLKYLKEFLIRANIVDEIGAGSNLATKQELLDHNTSSNAHITNIVSQTDIDKAINNLINGVPIDASVADKPITLKYIKEFLIRANIVDDIGGGGGGGGSSDLVTRQELLDHNVSGTAHGDIRSSIGSGTPGSSFTITTNNNSVIEGGNIVLNLATNNIPNGTQYLVRSKTFVQDNKPFIQTLESFCRFSPKSSAYDRVNEVIWLAVISSRTILKYDIATNTFVGVINLDSAVATSLFNQYTKLILNTNLNRLYIQSNEYLYINLNDVDFSVDTSILVTPTITPFNYWQYGNIYNATKNCYWMYNGSSIYRRDATTGTLLATFDFSTIYDYVYSRVSAMTYDPRNNSIWVTLSSNNSIYELNADTLIVKSSRVVSLHNPPTLFDIVYDHVNNRIWTYQLRDSGVAQIYIIDAATGDDVERFTLGNDRIKIVYDEVNNCMWIFSYVLGKFYKIDAKTADILGTYSSGPAFIDPDTYYSSSLNCLVQINGGINREVGLISKFDISALPESGATTEINIPVAPNNVITITNNAGSITIPVPLNTITGNNQTVVFEALDSSGLAVATSPFINVLGINNPIPPNTNGNSLLSIIKKALSFGNAKSHYLASIN